MKLLLALVVVLVASTSTAPVLAQRRSETPDALSSALAADWDTMQNAQRHVLDVLRRLLQERAERGVELEKALAERDWWRSYAQGLQPK